MRSMKTIKTDENAHGILLWAKEQCNNDGIENPNFSDAIRWMREELEKQRKND